MKTIYIDQQIVIESSEGGEVAAAIESCKSNGIIFPYSPAHVEEISSAYHSKSREEAMNLIPILDQISDGWAIMPGHEEPARICKEDIYDCLSRVQDNGGRDLTEAVAEYEKSRIDEYYKNITESQKNNLWDEISKCSHEDIFKNINVYLYITKISKEDNFRIHVCTFNKRAKAIEGLFDVLNIFGFQKVQSSARIEGRIHDVSHAIYGSYADIFVTNDRKLRNSSKAVYKYTGIETDVLDRDEFLKLSEKFS